MSSPERMTSSSPALQITMFPSTPSPLLTIHLLMSLSHITAFNAALATHPLPPSITLHIHIERLNSLPPSLHFDAIVSPANSYARLDGGFDDALSRALSPRGDYLALTRLAQQTVYREWRGMAPVGSCTLVDLEGDVPDTVDGPVVKLPPNPWSCRYLAVLPTMKIPQRVVWDKEVVYECMWALLATVDRHNVHVRKSDGKEGEKEISSVLMTPLATGYGGWPAARWAAQTVLAIRHFVAAVERGEGVEMDAKTIMELHAEVEETYEEEMEV